MRAWHKEKLNPQILDTIVDRIKKLEPNNDSTPMYNWLLIFSKGVVAGLEAKGIKIEDIIPADRMER